MILEPLHWRRGWFNPTRIRPDYTSEGTLDTTIDEEEADIPPNYTSEETSDQEQEDRETSNDTPTEEESEPPAFVPRRNPPRERKVPARYR